MFLKPHQKPVGLRVIITAVINIGVINRILCARLRVINTACCRNHFIPIHFIFFKSFLLRQLPRHTYVTTSQSEHSNLGQSALPAASCGGEKIAFSEKLLRILLLPCRNSSCHVTCRGISGVRGGGFHERRGGMHGGEGERGGAYGKRGRGGVGGVGVEGEHTW
jgi:hypothetical protein